MKNEKCKMQNARGALLPPFGKGGIEGGFAFWHRGIENFKLKIQKKNSKSNTKKNNSKKKKKLKKKNFK